MYTLTNVQASKIEWTQESVETAIQDFEDCGHVGKISVLASTNIPSEFIQANQLLTYRIVRICVRNEIAVRSDTKSLFLRILRGTDAASLPNPCRLVDRSGRSETVNQVLLDLVLEHRLGVSPATLDQLVRYIYTGVLEKNQSLEALLVLKLFARRSLDGLLQERVFSAICERVLFERDTVEERCALIGLAALDCPRFQRQGRFKQSMTGLMKELSSLSPRVTILSLDPQQLPRLFVDSEWDRLLHVMALLLEEARLDRSCLGAIRPRYLRPEFFEAKTFESAVFRSILQADSGGIIISLHTMDDVEEWNAVYLSRALSRDGLTFTNSKGESFSVVIDSILVSTSLDALLRGKYGQDKDPRDILPCTNMRNGFAVVGTLDR